MKTNEKSVVYKSLREYMSKKYPDLKGEPYRKKFAALKKNYYSMGIHIPDRKK